MNQVQMAAKLYECRDNCKKLWGAEWKKQVEFHTNIIKAVMQKDKIDYTMSRKKLPFEHSDFKLQRLNVWRSLNGA